MAIQITSITDGCITGGHKTLTVNDEGTTRIFNTTLNEVDELIEQLGGNQQAKKVLIMLWAAYRRSQSRTITGVNIA